MKLKKVLLDLLTGPTLGVWLARPFLPGPSWQWEPGDPASSEMPAASVLCCFAGLSCRRFCVKLAFLYQGKENRESKGCSFPFRWESGTAWTSFLLFLKEINCPFPSEKNHLPGTSQVAQELRLRLPMEGVRIWSLVRGLDPMWLVAKKPKHKQQKQ